MLSPDYLIHTADDVANIYSELHTATLKDISRRLVKSLKHTGQFEITSSSKYQIERLLTSGLPADEIEKRIVEIVKSDPTMRNTSAELNANLTKRIQKTLKKSEKEIKGLFDDVAIKNYRFESLIYNQAGILVPAIDTYKNILQANIKRLNTSLRNMTGTFAINTEERFKTILATAYSKTASGAFSYTQAVNSAVDDLARDGVDVFDYKSGRAISVEAAVLMNVRTSVNQTAAEMTKQMMIDTGTSYVQVSAHLNARNKGEGHVNHELWQGGVYYWKEIATEPNINPAKYKDFVTTCGYGLVDGIHGPNCRHGEGAFIPGVSNIIHSNKELEEMANKRYTFTDPISNKEYTLDPYAASQMQRNMERRVRDFKRAFEIYDSADDATPEMMTKAKRAKAKVGEWQHRLIEFTEQTGLKRQYFREKIA